MILERDKIKDWLSENNKSVRLACIATGILFYALVGILYYTASFSIHLLVILSGAAILIGYAFPNSLNAGNYRRITLADIGIGSVLALALAPLYLFLSYDIPFHVSTDEFIFIKESKDLIYSANPDLFGLMERYFYFPVGSFFVNGYIAKYFGDFDLQTLRRIDGFFGLLIVFCSYFFFRIFYTRKSAVLITALLGCSHSLFGLSRTAMRENHCLLIELIALMVLINGLRQANSRKLYAGGGVLGLLMYTHYSGRIVPLMWFVFLLIYCLKKHLNKDFLKKYLRLALPTFIGFILIATPMFLALYKAPEGANNYAKEQMLIYPQGRAFVQDWERKGDLTSALLQNTLKGLTTFNNNFPDQTSLYWHRGNGFVDPLTGLFLWLGMFALTRRKNKGIFQILTITGFIFIWLFISFFTTKNPSFHRLLVILPFVVILSFEGVKFLATFLSSFFARRKQLFRYRNRLVILITIVIALLNFSLYADYISEGLRSVEGKGATMRYVYSHRYVANLHYYIIYDEQHPYHQFGGDAWADWIRLSANPDQSVVVLKPSRLLNSSEPIVLSSPATILLSGDLWDLSKQRIMQEHPDAIIYFISGDRKQIAVEISK